MFLVLENGLLFVWLRGGLLQPLRRALILLDPLTVDRLAGVGELVDRFVENAL